ncbi:Ycf66 family protein [Nodosilinea sp. AN01ver1]|uniref:Ycf66 family protein n=1 Tax=Nodosilinea sp. AN01ver1 TaxID=3423362 RepID=UPI003D3180D0
MGVQVLAIAVWLGSIALYGAAFFFPEVHRRHDFFWSGVGGFYGLVLWFSAVQTSPTELVGHLASVVLLGWLGWQTLTLRRKRTPLDLQTPLSPDSWPAFGRQLKQSALNLLRATPLGRWLPETETGRQPGDPAIAVSEIRVSSLKDVDYEFVDELEPVAHRSIAAKTDFATIDSAKPGPAKTRGQMPKPAVAESASAPVPVSKAKRPPRFAARSEPDSGRVSLRESPAPPPASTRKPTTLGARLAGLKAWVGDVVTAKTKPKPKRAVIEIPPRPSPLAKNKTQPAARPDSPTENRSDPAQPLGSTPGITIVDTEAIASVERAEPGDRSEASVPNASSVPSEATGTEAPAGFPSPDTAAETETEETNWDDDENWADS